MNYNYLVPSHSSRRLRAAASGIVGLALLGAACGSGGSGQSTTLRVSGSTTVNPVAADAAEILRRQGMTITVDTQGGSAGGLAQLAAGQIEIAMSSKPVGDGDRSKHPGIDFVSTEIGADAVAIVVLREVADGGLTSLSKDQVRALFEGRIANWKELGGPDLDVFVYDKEPGRGTREVLDAYLYGKGGKAPAAPPTDRHAIVGGNEETRTKLLSTPGAVAPLSASFINGYPKLVALPIDGVAPTGANITNGTYPLARPLFFVTRDQPAGQSKRFIDFVRSAEGQRLVNKHGYITVAELGR